MQSKEDATCVRAFTFISYLFWLRNVFALTSPYSVGSGETELPGSSIPVINWAVTSWGSFTQAQQLNSCITWTFEKHRLDVSIKLSYESSSWYFVLLESA